MTHTILLVNNYLTNPLTDAIMAVCRFFKGCLESLIEARQIHANFYIAKLLHEKDYYKTHSFHAVYTAVNEGKLEDLKK